MNAIPSLLTGQLDIWTAAETGKKSGRGRNGGNGVNVYGIKKLRELILELAVRGKLVPQDPDDEPAGELLKRMQAEKAKLIAEGKIKKDKPLPPISDEEKPFELPQGWEWTCIGSIGHDWGQKTPDSDFTYIEVSAIDSQRGIISSPTLVKPQNAPSRARKMVKEGTVIYSTVRPYLLNIAVIEEEFLPEPIASTAFAVIHPFCLMPSRYFLYFFRSPVFIRYVESVQMGIAYPAINDSQFFSGLISLPPLPEQHRIVAKVDELMTLCDQLETQHINAAAAHEKLVSHLLGTLTQSHSADDFSANWQRIAMHFDTLFTTEASIDALKQTLLQLALMGKLVPQDPDDEPASELLQRIQTEKAKLIAEGKIKKDKPLPPITDEEKPFELPQGWEWVRLDELTNLITKGSSPKWQGVNYTDNREDVMFITSENVGSYSLLLNAPKYVEKKFNEIEPRSILARGDFLMNIVGASIGRTAVYNFDVLANINQAVCLIRISTLNLLSAFLLHFFNSETCLGYMFDKQVDNARPNLSMGNIAKFLIPIPPLAEQHRIVAKVDQLMALCNQLKSRIAQAGQLQKKLADVVIEQAIAS